MSTLLLRPNPILMLSGLAVSVRASWLSLNRSRNSCSVRVPTIAATKAPPLAPEMTAGHSPCSISAFSTPHQGRAPVTVARTLKELDALGPRDRLEVTRREVLECVADLGDVVLDQLLGAALGAQVELRLAHAIHVAVDALVQHEEQPVVVVLAAQLTQLLQPETGSRRHSSAPLRRSCCAASCCQCS